MEQNHVHVCSEDQERDVLNILMDSNLYLELSLDERHILLKHIVEFYRTPVTTSENYS